jgi:hypothetical protein
MNTIPIREGKDPPRHHKENRSMLSRAARPYDIIECIQELDDFLAIIIGQSHE